MYRLASILALGAVVLLGAGLEAARPPKAPKAPKGHQHIDGTKHMSADRMAQLNTGTHPLHTHKEGHKSFVKLKNGKVAGMHMVSRHGKKVQPTKVKKVAALGPSDSDIVLVGLGDEAPTLAASALGGIRISFQLGPLTISFFWPLDLVDPDLAGGSDDDDGMGV
jgi:hypothetical protein